MKYYDNKEQNGLIIDWKMLQREYHKLNVPSDFYQLPFARIEKGNKFLIALSERKTGKTTNWLLLGMLMNKHYDTVIQYVRESETEISPSHATKLFEVIRTFENGRYIKQITDGRWNDIYYHWRQFFYCKRDETGFIVEKAPFPFMQFLSCDKSEDYKSTYNAPTGDLILFDEFIKQTYKPNTFIDFFNILSTVIRDRKSPIVVMLANTINRNSLWFEELEISKTVKNMKKGESKEIITTKGTRIFVDMVETGQKEKKKIFNRLFFGFSNPKLNAITGDEIWNFDNVPHIITGTQKTVLENRIYIEHGIELLQLEIVSNEEQGLHLEVHFATRTHDDSIILTLGEINDRRKRYGIGYGGLPKKILKFIDRNLVYFSSNEVGSVFYDYLTQYKRTRVRFV